jgi:hypothetical protein
MGMKYYNQWRMERAAMEALRQAQEEQARLKEVLPPSSPWLDMPLASDFVAACMEALDQVNLEVGNWDVKTINCIPSSLAVSWAPRKEGWLSHLKAVEPRAKVSADGQLATLSVPLPSLQSSRRQDVAESLESRVIHLHDVVRSFGVDLATQIIPGSAPPALPGQEGGVIPPPTWQEIRLMIDRVLVIDDLVKALDGPGFRIRTITGTMFQGAVIWKIEGAQYVQM